MWSDTLATMTAGYHALDFFLRGMLLQICRQEITEDFATITEDMLENTLSEIDYRLDVLRATKGAHVEVY